MGYLLHLLAALALVATHDAGLTRPAPLGLVFGAFAVAALVPHALGALLERLLVRGRFRSAAIVERVLRHAPPALQAVLVLGFGWCEALQSTTGLEPSLVGWPRPALLAAIAPYIVLELLVADALSRAHESGGGDVARARAFQARLFLSTLLPFAAYVGVSALIDLHQGLRVHVEEITLLNAGFTLLLLACFVLCLPPLLRRAWDTVPLESGGLRELLEEVARQAGFRCREILVWRTGNQMANAAIVGFTPNSRIVLFSDALLAQLQPREIAAVFAHEIGHATRRHALIFAGFAAVLFLGADLVEGWLAFEDPLHTAALFLAALVLWYLSFGYLSRRFELEADLESRATLGQGEPLISALAEVSGAHARKKSSWRHFSTDQRIAFLRRVDADPAEGERLRRRLRRLTRLGLLVLAAVFLLQARGLVRSFGAERVVALLRLGRYEEAAERLRAGVRVTERVAALVARGLEVAPGSRAGDALAERALGELQAGHFSLAGDFAELAVLREREELRAVLEALELLSAGDDAGAEERLAELGPTWRQALDAGRRALSDGTRGPG